MLGTLGLPELMMLLVVCLGFAFWVWMLIEAATKESAEGQDRLIWVLIVLFGSLIGAAVYFFVRRPQRIATLGR
jgi:cytochrome c oxidase assembly factor CtaG